MGVQPLEKALRLHSATETPEERQVVRDRVGQLYTDVIKLPQKTNDDDMVFR